MILQIYKTRIFLKIAFKTSMISPHVIIHLYKKFLRLIKESEEKTIKPVGKF